MATNEVKCVICSSTKVHVCMGKNHSFLCNECYKKFNQGLITIEQIEAKSNVGK